MNINKRKAAYIPFYGSNTSSSSEEEIYKKKNIAKRLINYSLARIAYNFPIRKVRVMLHRMRGVTIGKSVNISRRVTIDLAYPEFVYIDDYAAINLGTVILAHTNTRDRFQGLLSPMVEPVVIGKYCMVGINCTILPGVTTGDSSILVAGSVINKDIPDYTISYGMKKRDDFCFKKLIKKNL